MKFFQNGKIKNKIKVILQDEGGFSLMEIMIAIMLFTIFFTVFHTSMSYNVMHSSLMQEEIILKELATRKMNEILISPPPLHPGLTLAPKTKTFNEKDIDNSESYKYTLTYKKFKLPDLSKIMGQSDDKEGGDPIQKQMFQKAKKNMEELVWQVEVKVENKETKYFYSLSSWLLNTKAKVEIGL
jgi:Tfp pilus assembly protein PilE